MKKLTKIILVPLTIAVIGSGAILISNMNQEEPAQIEQSAVTFDGEAVMSGEVIETVEVIETTTERPVDVPETVRSEVVEFSQQSVLSYINETYGDDTGTIMSSLVIVFLANESLFNQYNYKSLLGGMEVFLSNPDNRFAHMGLKRAELERLANL